jgi:hypothetical protein
MASKQVTKTVGKPASVATPALYVLMAKHELNLRATKDLTFVIKQDSIKLVYGFTF